MKNAVFWDVTPCGSYKNRRFEGTYRLRHQGENNQRARATRRHIPEDVILYSHSHENLKSYQLQHVCVLLGARFYCCLRDANKFAIKPTHPAVRRCTEATQALKFAISTPNFLRPLGPEGQVPSDISLDTSLVKTSCSLLHKLVSRDIYILDILQ
jgi:hypothetical protein